MIGMPLMTIHSYLESRLSKESNSERGGLILKSDMMSKVHNLPFDKIYEAVKMFSWSLCKIKNKNIDLKQVKIDY